jgi:signal transduction histidine kinase
MTHPAMPPADVSPTPAPTDESRGALEALLERVWEVAPIDADAAERELGAAEPIDRRTRAIFGVVRARIALKRVRLDEADAALGDAADVLADEPRWMARVLLVISNGRFFAGEFAHALDPLVAGLALAESVGDLPTVAAALNGIAGIHHRLGEFPTALEYYRRSLGVREAIGEVGRTAATLNNMGTAYFALGDPMAAIEHYRRALEIHEGNAERMGIARSLSGLGIALCLVGDHVGALEHHQRSLAIDEELGYKTGIAATLHNIGYIHGYLGDHASALEYYRRSLELERELGDQSGEATSLESIGKALDTLGDHAGALEHFEQSLEICRRIEDRPGIAGALDSLATVDLALGNIDEALARFRDGLEIREALGDRAGIAESLRGIGTCLVSSGRLDEARETFERSLEHASAAGARAVLVDVHAALVGVVESLGDYQSAMTHLREQYRVKEEMTTEEARQRLDVIESARKIEIAQKEAEIERLRSVELASALDRLKAAQAQLVHAEKMSSLGQLTAGIAHEINNPVNFLRTSISPLRRDLLEIRQIYHAAIDSLEPEARARMLAALAASDRDELAAEVEGLLDGIAEGAIRTSEIVRGLRTFSRLDEDELKEVDLLEGIESTLTLLGSRLDAITVVRDLAPLPGVECYPGQINQVFMNLLTNAVDACGPGGTISITTTSDDAGVRVTIADTGSGISSEHLSHIFEPFFTTKPVGSGQGLGLAIAHSIVENHGGAMIVESEVGVGSTFTVVLPRGD